MADIKFAAGVFFNEPRENAPDYVLGSISIRPREFVDWLREQDPDDKGYIRLAVKRSKAGKAYVALDTWKPAEREVERPEPKARW